MNVVNNNMIIYVRTQELNPSPLTNLFRIPFMMLHTVPITCQTHTITYCYCTITITLLHTNKSHKFQLYHVLACKRNLHNIFGFIIILIVYQRTYIEYFIFQSTLYLLQWPFSSHKWIYYYHWSLYQYGYVNN